MTANPAIPSDSVPSPHKRRRKVALRVALAIVIAIGAFLVWKVFFATPRVPEGIVQLSGRIEGDDSAVASKASGRVLEVHAREGDIVNAGEVIAVLSDDQIRAREDQARAALAQAEAKAKAARDQIAILEAQLGQNQLQTEQSKIDAEGLVRQADANLAAAEADLSQQEAAYKIAEFDKEAYAKLAKSGTVSERQGLQSAAAADQQAAAVNAAKRRVTALEGALTAAKASLSNPGIREAQAAMVRGQIIRQNAEIAGANADIGQARAQLAEAEANRQDLIIKAPFTGTVITRTAEPGEVLVAGTPVITLLNLRKVYLRGFIPEGQIGKVKAGQPARVYLDSDPRQPIDAYVSRIDPQATFTPENTYFREDRVKQVVGVKLQLKGGMGFAKPGMPADGEVLVEGDRWPEGKRK
ncbi:MAG TPA: HlyD family efflux transporter periplasmic adaptor subunit [Bryobacteraceae bacterium]|nr:HlyD family efflux transporter periplasmic adaptor subunit [Bryobacteraceae bacterium]